MSGTMKTERRLVRPAFGGLAIEQRPDGLLIAQDGRAYIARDWRLTKDVARIVDLALGAGLTNMIQNGHPQESKLLPHGDGADYMTFSNAAAHRWIFVLDMDSCSHRCYPAQVKFNKKFKHVLRAGDIDCPPEWRSPQELQVAIADLPRAFSITKPYWDRLANKKGLAAERGRHSFFVDEEDLHSHIVQNWQGFPLSRRLRFRASKHLIGSPGNRIGEIDILSEDDAGNVFVIELKNNAVFNTGGETPDRQLGRYMRHVDIGALTVNGGKVFGVLIAQSIEHKLRTAIRAGNLPIVAYEATKTGNGVKLQEVSRAQRSRIPL